MKILKNQILAPYTTYQIGGPADFFVEVSNAEEVTEALEWAAERDLPVYVLGGGSNLLFDDSGFRGLVLRLHGGAVHVEEERVRAGAGVLLAELVQAAGDAGLSGLEEWTGLPGTVGGAVTGNAGCFGVEVKDRLEKATVWSPGEGLHEVDPDFFAYRYRWSRLKKDPGIVVEASFRLQRGEIKAVKDKMKNIARSRIQKQPAGSSTGSFFKNPPGDHAGRLIEAADLKGMRVGKAEISAQHANFLLNRGGASSADVLALAQYIQNAVKERFGVELEREVVYVAPEGLAD